jgi:16S rRNA (cytidine1402-2'-O)-methyltransferase
LDLKQGTLYLIPAPLSDCNLDEVLPSSVFRIADSLKFFIVEDLRTSRRYLSSLKIQTSIDELNFFVLNEHTPAKEIEAMLKPLEEGRDAGLLSDAGMPCIADPGEELVAAAHRKGIKVVPLVGPSSILLALTASGLCGERFTFAGYPPAKTPELSNKIKQFEQISKREGGSVIFIETPYRSARLLETLARVCLSNTMICLACDLTSEREFILVKSAAEWRKHLPEIPKSPCIFIIQA